MVRLPIPFHHARGIEFDDVSVRSVAEDRRSAFVVEDVDGANFQNVNWRVVPSVPAFGLHYIRNFNLQGCLTLADRHLESVDQARF